MSASLSTRGIRSYTAFNTAIPEVTENVYDKSTNPSGIISLALSENHLVHGPVTEYINKNFHIDEIAATTYAGSTIGGPRLRKAMVDHVNKYFHPLISVNTDNVCVGNGVTAICSMLAFMLGDVGDGILLMRPIYGKFENDLTILTGCKTLYVDMGDTDPFSESIVQCYEERFHRAKREGTTPRAVLLCNPHNPSGICYSRSTLIALLRFCAIHNLHLICDEIYALTTFPVVDQMSESFTSVLALDTSGIIDPRLIHVLYGVSKDLGAPGLHVAALITRNDDVVKAFRAVGLIHAPSGLSCAIATTMLEDEEFMDGVVALMKKSLAENYELVTRKLEEAGIPYWRGGRAGFFLWVDLSAYLPKEEEGEGDEGRERRLSEKLAEGGVWLNPGAEWAERRGWFRIIYSHDKSMVDEAIGRIIRTLKGDKKAGK